MKTITADRVADEIEQGHVQIINVLPPEDFSREHIPGSLNVPASHPQFVDRVEQLVGDKQARVIVYCASPDCSMSEDAAKKLEGAGFKNVMDFTDGMRGWKDADQRTASDNDEMGRPLRAKISSEPSARHNDPKPHPKPDLG